MAVQSSLGGVLAAERPGERWADPALVFACAFAVLTLVSPRLLGDPDTQWHVAVGASIWRDGAVPWTDAFSHTAAGAPWIAKEWLSQLLLFGAWRVGGWTGVAVLTAAALALLFAMLFGWLAARLRGTLALTVTLLATVLLAPHFLARPHVFAFLPLFLWARGLVDALDEGRPPPFRLAAVMTLWANLHGSFTFGYVLAAMLAGEAILAASASERRRVVLRWALFGALSLAAGCLTPYGVHALLVTFTVFGSGESLPFINEWQPIGWTFIGGLSVGVAGLFAAALAATGRGSLVRIGILLVLTAMLVRHSRFLDVFAIVAPLLVAVPLARRVPALEPDPSPMSAASWAGLPHRIGAGTVATGLLVVVLLSPQPDPAVTPRAALAAARAAGVSGPVYNSYDFGGFLLSEGVPTFIDGRTDQLFLGGFISGLFDAIKRREHEPFLDLVSRHGATWSLVMTGTPEARHFDAAPDWKRVHRDDVASVFVRDWRGSLP